MNSPFTDIDDRQKQVSEMEGAWPEPSLSNILLDPELVTGESETTDRYEDYSPDDFYAEGEDYSTSDVTSETIASEVKDQLVTEEDNYTAEEIWHEIEDEAAPESFETTDDQEFLMEETNYFVSEDLIDEEAYEEEDVVESLFSEEFDVTPDRGITLYLNVSAVENRSLKTGVFIPAGYRKQDKADLVIYFHGIYPNGNKSNGMELYWKNYSNIRACFAESRRNAILISPALTTDPQQNTIVFGKPGGFDRFVNSCISELKTGNHLDASAQPGRIIIAGHSGGGSPIMKVLTGKHSLVPNIIQCWGFDCFYEYGWERLKTNIPVYHYWAYNAYGKPSGPGIKGESLQKLHSNFFNIAPKAKIYHQGIIEHAWRNEINKREWFDRIDSASIPVTGDVGGIAGGIKHLADTATKAISAWATLSPTKRTVLMIVAGNPQISEQKALELAWTQKVTDANELTNLVFYLRHRDLLGRKLEKTDPQHLKDEWLVIRSNIVVPFLSSVKQSQPVNTPAPVIQVPGKTPVFTRVSLQLSTTPLVLVAGNAARKLAEVKESPSVFLKNIVSRALGADAARDWFSNFTRISFLGRELNANQYIHVELATHLKEVEREFAAKYGGSAMDPAVAGDFLLGTKRENLAGSRAVSATATYSFHMFGLAIDVNYSTNPYIQNKERYGRNEKTGQRFTKPNGVKTLNETLSRAGSLLDAAIPVLRYGLGYSEYDAMNKLLVSYLTLADNSSKLQNLLNSTSSSFWKSKTVDEAVKIINKDLDTLSLAVDRWNIRESFRKTGFLNLSKEFVDGIKLDWGGKGYGDMMHFDMRNTGAGAKIKKAIGEYISLKQAEASDKYRLQNKEISYI